MIELRNFKRMHVYHVSRARSSKRTRIYRLVRAGGGRVYEIKTPRSNLAPEEGGGAFIRGGRMVEQVGIYGMLFRPHDSVQSIFTINTMYRTHSVLSPHSHSVRVTLPPEDLQPRVLVINLPRSKSGGGG